MPSISVSAACYHRLRLHGIRHDLSVRDVLEQALAYEAPPRAPDLAAVASAPAGAGLRRCILPISEELAEDVWAAAMRTGRGMDGEIDHAVNAMLDELERGVWCRGCLEALEFCECRVARTKGG